MTAKHVYLFLIILFIINILSLSFASAEVVIYDNITTSQYKMIKIGSDNLNIEHINEYQYEVYVNGSFLGNYNQGSDIFVPDNTNVSIWIPSPIKTGINDVYKTIIEPTLITFLGFFFTWGLGLLIASYFLFKLYKDLRK